MGGFQQGYWLARQINYFSKHPGEFFLFVLIPSMITLAWKIFAFLLLKGWGRRTVTLISSAAFYELGLVPALYAVPATTVAYSLAWIALAGARGTARGWSAILAGVYHLVTVRRLWASCCQATQFLTSDGFPIPTSRWRITQHGLTVELSVGAMGKTESSALEYADRIRSNLYVNRARMKKLSSGVTQLALEWGDHLKQISLWDIPEATRSDMLAIGITEYGKVFELQIGKSVLATGLTRAGKSSFAWALVFALIRAGIPFRLTIGDPKFVEWKIAKESADASPIVYRYTNSPADLGTRGLGKNGFMWQIEQELTEKLKKIPVGKRVHVPTIEEPLDVVIIDETLPITKELKKEDVNHPLAKVVYQGAAAGTWVVFLSQSAEKDVIGPVRDLVPTRLAFAVSGANATRTALGEDAISRGAMPHLLDPDADAGICYFNDEGRFGAARVGFATDADVPYLIMGELPPRPGSEPDKFSWDRPCYVYMYYGPDEFGERELKYVGEAFDWEKRYSQHEENEPAMMLEVVKEWTEVDLWPSKASAEWKERELIKKLHPKWNKQHNGNYYRGT